MPTRTIQLSLTADSDDALASLACALAGAINYAAFDADLRAERMTSAEARHVIRARAAAMRDAAIQLLPEDDARRVPLHVRPSEHHRRPDNLKTLRRSGATATANAMNKGA